MPGPVNMGVCPITVEVSGTVQAHRFVGVTGAAAGAGANTLGVAAYDGTDEPTTIDTLGVVSVEAGAALSAGDEIEVDATSRGITKVAGKTVARALDDASAEGEYFRAALIPN